MDDRTGRLRTEKGGDAASARFDAGAVIRILARPRMTGSAGADAVEAELRDRFEGLGFSIRSLPFHFSMTAGRFALSKIAAVYTVGMLVALLLLASERPLGAVIALSAAFVLMVAGILYMRENGIARMPWGRSQATNLWVQRAGGRPRYVFMAHRDSKSQLVPLSLRGPAIALGIVAWIAMVVLAVMSMARFVGFAPVLLSGLVGVACGLALVVSWPDDHSPGALDNASGLATLLGIAERERSAEDIAFLVTDAEELGLAGARAIAPRMPPVFGVINVDGIDDHGTFHVVERFGWPRKKGLAPHLAAAVLGAADRLGMSARRRDAPFGILLDHMPLVEAGTPALSIMRGSLRSLHRVHRPADSVDNLTGTGVEACVELLCGALAILRERDAKV